MKTAKLFAWVILSFAFIGCREGVDLALRNLNVDWNATNKKAKAEIANIGDMDSGNFLVYFNGEENPVSPNHRPQVTHNIPNLARGTSITLEADFAPLAHSDNNNLGNVVGIRVIVDPKNTVKEFDENNNEKVVPIR